MRKGSVNKSLRNSSLMRSNIVFYVTMLFSNSRHAFPSKFCGFCMFPTVSMSSEDKMNSDNKTTSSVLHNVKIGGDSMIFINLSLPGFTAR